MNKLIASAFAVALCGSVAMADVASAPAPSAKDLKEAVETVNYVETAQKGIVLSGYVDAGYTYNFIGRDTGSTFTTRNGSENKAGGSFNLNALKVALEKPLTDANEWQAGFRADLIVGQDAAFVGGQNAASSDSLFLEQAYAQFRAPVGNGIDIKVGKFVTTLGYEVIERPVNLNISYGELFQNAIPLWHVGALASYEFSDVINAKFGVVNGANVDGLATTSSYPAFLASLGLNAPGGNASIGNNVYFAPGSSNDAASIAAGGAGSSIIYDLVGNWTPKFANDKLLLGFNGDIGNSSQPGYGSDTWWGAAVYAKYQFTDIFSLAGRGEYFHDADGSKLGFSGIPAPAGSGSADVWAWTLTAGFDVIENLALRAEYRLDYGNNVVAGSAGTEDIGHSVSAEVVYSF
jgi:hypothetical protein